MDTLLPGLEASRHIHPMFVHLPLVLVPGALVFWLVAQLRHRGDLWGIGSVILYVGIAAALLAITTGFAASNELGHDSPGHDLVHVHRNFMLTGAALSVAVAIAAFALRRNASGAVRWSLIGALTVATAVLTLGADRGVYLVFGQGVGVDLQPPGGDAETSGEHEHAGHAH